MNYLLRKVLLNPTDTIATLTSTMKAVVAALLVAALVSLTTADQPWVEPGQGCVYGISVYEVGETFNKECDTCTCLADGKEHSQG